MTAVNGLHTCRTALTQSIHCCIIRTPLQTRGLDSQL